MAITTSNQTLGSLEIGTTINYSNCIHAVDTNYKVMNHYADKWGNWTEVLNLETMEFDQFTQHTKMELRWSVVK